MGDILIRIAYGVMIVGVILCFLFSRNHQRDIRKAANDFALTFVKLSNYLSPKPPKEGLKVEHLPEGGVRPLPLSEQDDGVRATIRRIDSARTAELFAQLDEAADQVAKRVGFNRTHKSQFQAPVDRLLLLTHTFLTCCERLESLDTEAKLADFNSYLLEQPQHRMVLLKRITGDKADEYRELNRAYATEMERIEEAEWEAKQQKKKGKSKK